MCTWRILLAADGLTLVTSGHPGFAHPDEHATPTGSRPLDIAEVSHSKGQSDLIVTQFLADQDKVHHTLSPMRRKATSVAGNVETAAVEWIWSMDETQLAQVAIPPAKTTRPKQPRPSNILAVLIRGVVRPYSVTF